MAFERLEAMDLDGLSIDFQSFFLVYKKFFDNVSLVSLKLNHVASLFIVDNGTIASELLLDNLENLLEIELVRNSLNCRQGLTTISLLDTNMDIWGYSVSMRLSVTQTKKPTGWGGFLGSIASVLILRVRKGI